jgi:energy-coupling factor transporter ATP-binding protein EcfA2
MDTTELQAKLASLSHLTPSQHEWLERLLFQLAFNDSKQIQATGAAGAGKSTLAMAVAELFSGQYNVAMLNPPVDEAKAQQQLIQQWFGAVWQADSPLAEQVNAQPSTLPLLLIIDDAEHFSSAFLQQLEALPCVLFCFSVQTVADNGLVLTLGQITTADAEYLLQHENLNSIELAARLVSADGNLHLLLQSADSGIAAELSEQPQSGFRLSAMQLASAAAALLLIAVLAFVLWPAPEKKVVRIPFVPAAVVPASEPEELLPAEPIVSEEPVAEADIAETVPQPMPTVQDEIVVAEPDDTTSAITDDNQATVVVESEDVAAEPQAAIDYLFDEVQLLAADKQQVALQLAVLSSDAALQRFKSAYPQLMTLTYQRSWQGKMQLVLLLAPFTNATAAKAERDQLPEALQATGPFVKTMQAVQAEIKAQQRNQQSAGME